MNKLLPSLISALTNASLGLARSCSRPAHAAALGAVYYLVLCALCGDLTQVHRANYFAALADAFMHGRLWLTEPWASAHDLSRVGERYFAYWPPGPALFQIPWVFFFGPHFPDIWFNLIIGAINCALVAAVLEAGEQRRLFVLSPERKGLLVLCFIVGSAHTPLVPLGGVWFTGQIVGFMCYAAAILAALRRPSAANALLAGVGAGLTFLCRLNMLLGLIVPLWFVVSAVPGRRAKVLRGAMFVAPVLAAAGLFMAYNWTRFGSPFATGLAAHNFAAVYQNAVAEHGMFSLQYVPQNFFYHFVSYPFPLSSYDGLGGSLFLLSPIFFAALLALRRAARNRTVLLLASSALICEIPMLLLFGTGWIQFGPRYTLDYTVLLLLLAAYELQRWPLTLIGGCLAISGMHFLLGTVWLSGVVR